LAPGGGGGGISVGTSFVAGDVPAGFEDMMTCRGQQPSSSSSGTKRVF
jgi:hypothetical protein